MSDPITPRRPLVEIVVPVHNEERALTETVTRLHDHLRNLPFASRITIADNGGSDGTLVAARELERRLDGVRAMHLEEKGRGRALRRVWSASDADVLAYMDVGLSPGPEALLALVAPLISGHSDLAIGTRLAPGSRGQRDTGREQISRGYNRILRAVFRSRFTDAQCGLKAGRAEVVNELLAGVEDHGWFFDTELLMLAQRNGLRVHEVPVGRLESSESRGASVLEPLGPTSQLARFAGVGAASTVLYALLYLALRGVMGPWSANALALGLSAIANNAANRRLTFGRRGRRDAVRHHAQGLAVFAVCLALTTGTLALLDLIAPGAPAVVELLALCAANVLGTVLRFAALRLWVFGPKRGSGTPESVTPKPQAEAARAVSR